MIGRGVAPHSKAASFLAMAEELSVFMRSLEAGWVTGANLAWLLYRQAPAPAIGDQVRRVITEWSAASGRNLRVLVDRPVPRRRDDPSRRARRRAARWPSIDGHGERVLHGLLCEVA